MTDNFIVRETEDYDFQRMNQYWDAIPIDDLEDLSSLGSIILEWKLIEDTLQ